MKLESDQVCGALFFYGIVYIGFQIGFKYLTDFNQVDGAILFLPGAGVRFWLKGKTYQNNSLVSLDDIGENDNALLCLTDLTVCCRTPYTGIPGYTIGNWYFPSGTRVLSYTANSTTHKQLEIYRTRGQNLIYLHRKRGGATGIYLCTIPDGAGVYQNITVGLYTADTGE